MMLALGAVAASGHAGSADPRVPSILNDWLHLVSGALWLGGIGLLVALWWPVVRFTRPGSRVAIAREVLAPFGRIAIGAFLVAVSTGLVSLVTQLGRVAALWDTAYGRLLAVKIVVVGLIAAASFVHARRLRPAAAGGRRARARRAAPLDAVAQRAVARARGGRRGRRARGFPAAAAPARPGRAGAGRRLRSLPAPRPAADELGVADSAGSSVVAGWIGRTPDAVTGTVRLLDRKGAPARVPVELPGARTSSCGAGCRRFRLPAGATGVEVAVRERGERYATTLPATWDRGGNARARALLRRAQRTMRALGGVRELERLTSGPGTSATTEYRLRAPDRLAWHTGRGVESVVIGRRQWIRQPGIGWREQPYGEGLAFKTRSWFAWSRYAREVRLLSEHDGECRAGADGRGHARMVQAHRGPRDPSRRGRAHDGPGALHRHPLRGLRQALPHRGAAMTRSPARRALRAAGVLAAAAFVALLAYGLTTKATDSTIDDALSRGKAVAAPGFSLAALADGSDAGPAWKTAAADGKVSLDELRGTPLVVNFWASWCDPCRAEAKVLERAYKAQNGVLFLGLDAQDAREDARDFIAQFGLTFPHVRDPGNDTQRAWGVTGLPETYFIGAGGQVVGHVIGTVDDAQLRDGIAAAKAGRPQGLGEGGDQRPVK